VVVEAPPRPAATVSDTATRPHLLPLSAPDAAGLARWAERLAGLAGDGVDLGRLAWTLQAGRRRLPARAALVVGTAAEAAEALAALAAGRSHPARVGAPAPTAPEAGLAFLFPGQGVAAPGLLSGLTEQSAPVAVATVERLLEALDLDTAAELRRLIFEPANPEAAHALNRTEFAQPVLFLTGLATARQLEAWGHRAETVLGHSLGDWTSAALAGVIEERRALEAIRVRAAAMGEAAPGSMLSVGAPAADLLASLDGDLSLAADNAPNLSVVAGSEAPLARLEARLKADGIICHRLPVAHAFHSGAMAPAAARLQSELRGLVMAEPDRRYVSSVLGREVCLGDLADPGLWARQLTEPVRFRAAAAALGSPPPLMVEVGPGQTLQTLVTAQRGDAATIGTLPGPADEMPPARALMRTLGALWLAGRESRWATLQSVVPEKLSLPPYPFDRRRFWHLPKRLRDIARVSDGPERTTPAWHRLPWRAGTTGAGVADRAMLAEGARAVLEACRPHVGVSARAPALDRRGPLLIPMPVDRVGLPALVDRLIALGRSAFSGMVVLVTCGGLRVLGDEPVDPLAAAVQALSLSAAQELGPLAIHALDLDPEEPARGVDQALVWLSRSSPPRRLALRRGGVWRFGIADAREAGRSRSPLAGHLLLTGGGGRLGQAIACAIAGKARAGGLRLTLIGRRAAAPVGAGCHCLEADVSDRAALAASLERARAEAGPIDYVIHAAGPAAAAAYQPITRGWRPEVASAKWDGLENLLLALAPGEPRRSGLLVSSLATVLGGLGLASYAAANAAAEARALTAGPLWSALALDGLATQGSPGQDDLIALADAANEAERLLAEPTNTITLLAAKSLAPRLDIWVDGLTPPDADREAIALASDPANPIAGADLVRAIEAAFEDLLGHRPESKEADFFALGGDSLLLVRLLPRLTPLAGVPLGLADIAARASISGIVDVIAARRIETAARRTRTDTTPDRIGDLTMEEGEL
jgi:malonyl CoA-acyl carrier protein transacylase